MTQRTYTSFSAKLGLKARAFAVIVLVGSVATFGYLTLERITPPTLEQRVAAANVVLDAAKRTGTIPYKAHAANWTLPKTGNIDDKKQIFIAQMLPLIIHENQRIMSQRLKLERSPSDAQLVALGRAYGLRAKRATIARLQRRIDIIPPSLVLAQAALESGWGTSRFAQKGHAYFGERTFDPDAPGMSPKRASGFKVKSFRNAQLSVRSYMRTINTHRAYRSLRSHRANARAQGLPVSSIDLAQLLEKYSEIGQDYVERIVQTIEINDLQAFDSITIDAPKP